MKSITGFQNPQKHLTSDDLKGSFQGHKSDILAKLWPKVAAGNISAPTMQVHHIILQVERLLKPNS